MLRDDGINYSDYVTELVLLLFVKMEYEQAQNSPDFEHKLPEASRWPSGCWGQMSRRCSPFGRPTRSWRRPLLVFFPMTTVAPSASIALMA